MGSVKDIYANRWTNTLKWIISFRMTRRLLALLAILSGLAALHAPAHASSRLDQLSYDVETLAEIADPQNAAACLCVVPPQKPSAACLKARKPKRRVRLLNVLPALMMVGVDRSLE